jgi:hypothetical protein
MWGKRGRFTRVRFRDVGRVGEVGVRLGAPRTLEQAKLESDAGSRLSPRYQVRTLAVAIGTDRVGAMVIKAFVRDERGRVVVTFNERRRAICQTVRLGPLAQARAETALLPVNLSPIAPQGVGRAQTHAAKCAALAPSRGYRVAPARCSTISKYPSKPAKISAGNVAAPFVQRQSSAAS